MLYWVFGNQEGAPNCYGWTECDTSDKSKALAHLYKVMDDAEAEAKADGRKFEILDMIEEENTLEFIVDDGYGKPYHYGMGCDC